MTCGLSAHLNKLHTTTLGAARIKRNLSLAENTDVVAWCRRQIESADAVVRRGKNWYVYAGGVVITVNAHRLTLITAHREKPAPPK